MTKILSAAWVLLLLVGGPLAGLAARGKVRHRPPPRGKIYTVNALNLLLLGASTAAIDLTHGRKAISVLANLSPGPQLLSWTVGITAACLAISVLFMMLRYHFKRLPTGFVLHVLPQTQAERVSFVLLCILIGVVEEFLYRGFALLTLLDFLHSTYVAALIVAVSFALMHGLQDTIAIARAFILSVLFSFPPLVIGCLLPSMIAHAVVDIAAGLSMLRFFSCYKDRVVECV